MIEFIPATDESLAHFTDWAPSGHRWVFDADFPPPTPLGKVMADALNVHEATGLTPSQLQARVAELEAALRGVTGALDQMGDQPDRLVCPVVWRRLNCEELVAQGKNALGVE